MPAYVALLRGINVGGKNLIGMPALRECFEAGGFPDARTYIQSGNVVFETPERGAAALTRRIERMLSATFDYRATVVLRSRTQMRAVVDRAPTGFGTSAAKYRYDVIFVKDPCVRRPPCGACSQGKTWTRRRPDPASSTSPGSQRRRR